MSDKDIGGEQRPPLNKQAAMTSPYRKVRIQRSHKYPQHRAHSSFTSTTAFTMAYQLFLPPTNLTTLPAATVQKIINEVLASKAAAEDAQSMSFAKETRDLLIECCVEFITMISTEANEIAEKDAKKTIACEHITKALEELGFGEYVQEIMAVADSFKNNQVSREKKGNKMEQSGMSPEELARMQEELFRSAGDKFNAPTA
ncbi:hypothetical protein Q7P35_009181 [Cladosporium inversicolor]